MPLNFSLDIETKIGQNELMQVLQKLVPQARIEGAKIILHGIFAPTCNRSGEICQHFILSGSIQSMFSAHGANLDANRTELLRLIEAFEAGQATEAQVRRQMGIVQQDLGTYHQ